MTIQGIFTDSGLDAIRDAANNEGFYIYPTEFGVSDVAGNLDASRTTANSGEWFTANISSRVVVNDNAIQVTCTIPPSSSSNTYETIEEVYLYGRDSGSNIFLMVIAHPTDTITYDNTGSTILKLQIQITNVDLTENFIFQYTQATEISEHESSPTSHAEITAEMKRAGMFIPAGSYAFEYNGQIYDKNATFDGTVSDGDPVYYNNSTTNYEKALADGSVTANVVGIADVTEGIVNMGGFLDITTGYAANTDLYLSDSVAGTITDSVTSVKLGRQVTPTMVQLFITGYTNGFTTYQETPTGTVNGVNDTFTISNNVALEEDLLVFVDGVIRDRT